MSTLIRSSLPSFQHYRLLVLAALIVLPGLALLAQNAAASVPHLNQLNPETAKSYPRDPAPETTDTPTPTAVLVVRVSWTGLNELMSRDIPVTLTLTMSSTEITYPGQYTDINGYFTVSVDGLPSGTYDYWTKASKYLANAGTITLTGAPTTQLEVGTLTGADSDDSNVVDMADFAIFRLAFGRSCGDPLYDPRADYNNSCAVNSVDYGVLRSTLGRLGPPPHSPVPTSNGDAYLELQPGSGGNCLAPANGGTVQVGCRFVLDLMVQANSSPDGVGQQSYLTFTNSILQNARWTDIGSSCIITGTLTADSLEFDATMQNQVCNSPIACPFHQVTLPPGSIAYASGALNNQAQGGTFRVALIALCAVAPGPAVLRWQFSPPAPRNLHSAIIDASGNPVQEQRLFTDYVINVVDPNATSTPTITPTPTSTNTPTDTPTDTPTSTFTPTPTPMLVAHVSWPGINQPMSRDIPVTLTLTMGSTEVSYPNQYTDASGFFTVSVEGLASGTYDYWAKGSKYLANAGTVTLTGAPTTQLEIGAMFGGDADNSNVVDMIDFAVFKATFGRSCGDPLYDPRADFNNNCAVNTVDYSTLNVSIGTAGAPPHSPVPTSNGDGYIELQPGSGGNCPAPANGGTVQVGCRFVLDLMVNAGSTQDTLGQQSYLTFTESIIQNARWSTIGSSCVVTSTVTADTTSFDAGTYNGVCNGPGTCSYRGMALPPGTIGFASGALSNEARGGTFRVAIIGLCAVAPGQAVLHWQFSPHAPRNRHSAIIDASGNPVQDQGLLADYVINVVDPNATPTVTPTPASTPVIQGHGIWEGRDQQPHPSQMLPISLTLRLTTGGPYVEYPLQTTDASGHFTVPVAGLPNGTYNWRAKGPQFLANAGTISLAGDPVTVLEAGLLRTGDANGDNVVNVGDFNIVRGAFGTSCGQGGYDGRADFTGDCVVNAQDFNLLRRNFGMSGAPPTGLREP